MGKCGSAKINAQTLAYKKRKVQDAGIYRKTFDLQIMNTLTL